VGPIVSTFPKRSGLVTQAVFQNVPIIEVLSSYEKFLSALAASCRKAVLVLLWIAVAAFCYYAVLSHTYAFIVRSIATPPTVKTALEGCLIQTFMWLTITSGSCHLFAAVSKFTKTATLFLCLWIPQACIFCICLVLEVVVLLEGV